MHPVDEGVPIALKVADWLVPALVGASIFYLRNISTAIQDLSRSLAVAVQRVDSHEKRLDALEERSCGD